MPFFIKLCPITEHGVKQETTIVPFPFHIILASTEIRLWITLSVANICKFCICILFTQKNKVRKRTTRFNLKLVTIWQSIVACSKLQAFTLYINDVTPCKLCHYLRLQLWRRCFNVAYSRVKCQSDLNKRSLLLSFQRLIMLYNVWNEI